MDIFKKHCPYCCNPEQADDGSMEMVDHVIGMDDEIYCSRCDGHMSLFEDNESLECPFHPGVKRVKKQGVEGDDITYNCPSCEKEATALDKCYACGTALTECPDMKGFMECLACKPKTKVFLMVDATVLLEFPNMDTAEAWLNEQPDPVIFSTQLGLSAEEVKQGKVGDLAIPKVALHFDTWEWNTPDGKCPF